MATEHHLVKYIKYDEAGHWTKTIIHLLLDPLGAELHFFARPSGYLETNSDPLGAVLHISLVRPSGYFVILLLLLSGESYTIPAHPSRSPKIAGQLPIFENYRRFLDEWNCGETIACPLSLLALEFR